ncbi:hypothetical protein C1M53_27870 [Mesorhizobium sp. Pch-S]|jgi:hypothetical protein|nr:hypothetical protein C1M53_27870 [Mesorhizobium sp. Pch-S]
MPRMGFIGDIRADKPAEPEMPDRSRLFNTCGVFTAICVTLNRQSTIFGRDLVIGRSAVSLAPTYEMCVPAASGVSRFARHRKDKQ